MPGSTNIKATPPLSSRAFWDVDMHTLDFERHDSFIIIRVFERGTINEKQAITHYYEKERIIKVLTEAPSLLPAARLWAKEMFHLSDSDFLCCKDDQPYRKHSMY